MRVLVTTTSFQDTLGDHKELLEKQGFDLEYLRGPLTSDKLIDIIGNYDGIICGDDEINKDVILAAKNGKLKVISKYGIGIDKIDVEELKKTEIRLFSTPGVNNEAVAEHFFSLLLTFEKNIIAEHAFIQSKSWVRLIGHEIFEKSIGILGLGNVGKEIAKRAFAFGMKIYAYDLSYDVEFCEKYKITCCKSPAEMYDKINYLSLNLPLNSNTKHIIDKIAFNKFGNDIVIINTARSGLIDTDALLYSLSKNLIRGYLTDVLDIEPMEDDEALLNYENVIITPHIGSRNHETVERQGRAAVNNLINNLR